jgi:hypothetical protein
LGCAEIAAPVSGYASRSNIEPGGLVQAFSPVLTAMDLFSGFLESPSFFADNHYNYHYN